MSTYGDGPMSVTAFMKSRWGLDSHKPCAELCNRNPNSIQLWPRAGHKLDKSFLLACVIWVVGMVSSNFRRGVNVSYVSISWLASVFPKDLKHPPFPVKSCAHYYSKGIYICEHLLPDMCLNILYPQGSIWEGKEVVGVVGLAAGPGSFG